MPSTAPAANARKWQSTWAYLSAKKAWIGRWFLHRRLCCLSFGVGIEIGEGATISFDANDFHFNKTQLRASHATPALYFPLALQLMKDGHVDGESLISHTLPLEAIDIMQTQRESVLKIVITP
jgi:hypothetical protein